MEKLRFEFKLRGSTDGKTNVMCITSIETQDSRMFVIPDELQPATLHEAIKVLPAFTSIKTTLTKRNQYRKIWITVDDKIKNTYMDTDGNMIFKNFFLEEKTTTTINTSDMQESSVEELLKQLIKSNLKKEEKSIDKVSKEFILHKFDNKTVNAGQWIKGFEEECARFNLSQDKKKIEILKLFLDKNCLDWYECVLIKLTINSEWIEWKKRFCDTFANKGWTQIRYAMTFRYQAGSLIEYALKKEKLLLESRKTIDTKTLIDLIAISLSNFISDRIDREILEETEDLHN